MEQTVRKTPPGTCWKGLADIRGAEVYTGRGGVRGRRGPGTGPALFSPCMAHGQLGPGEGGPSAGLGGREAPWALRTQCKQHVPLSPSGTVLALGGAHRGL